MKRQNYEQQQKLLDAQNKSEHIKNMLKKEKSKKRIEELEYQLQLETKDLNEIYYFHFDQFKTNYPCISKLGIMYQRFKVLIEILQEPLTSTKSYEEYSNVNFFTDFIYQILYTFISLWTEIFIFQNRKIELRDLDYIYSITSNYVLNLCTFKTPTF